MGLRTNPTQRQRRLGAELRKLREAAGLSATQAGTYAGLGRAYMSHIETGRAGIPEEKLAALLEGYGIANDTLAAELMAMATAKGRGWWTTFSDAVDGGALDLAELESSASTHRSFQWLYVPGLLQTPEYARALFENGQIDIHPDRVARAVDFRNGRQQVLHRDSPPTFHAVIHEAAFHMHFVPRRVMREQLEGLLDLCRLPHVVIQLLPFRAPTYPATSSSPFVIFEARAPELRTLYIEHPVTSSFIDDSALISQFSTTFERLSRVALSPLRPDAGGSLSSLRLVQHLRYVLEETSHA